MLWLKKYLSILLLVLLLSAHLYSESYYPAEKIDPLLKELESLSTEQESQIQKLNQELITQSILVSDLKNQLNQAKQSAINCQMELEKAQTSLKIYERRELIHNILIAVSCFVIGGGVTYLITNSK